MSLLKEDITRNEQVEKVPELNAGDNSKKYKLKAIWDNAVYANKAENHLLGLYYLVV